MSSTMRIWGPVDGEAAITKDLHGQQELVLTFESKKQKRHLEITCGPSGIEYLATWFGEEGNLQVQEGTCTDFEETFRWLEYGGSSLPGTPVKPGGE